MSVQYLLDVSIVRVLDVSKVSALVCLPREVTIEGTVEKGTVEKGSFEIFREFYAVTIEGTFENFIEDTVKRALLRNFMRLTTEGT